MYTISRRVLHRHHLVQERIQRWGGRGSNPPYHSVTMNPLLIFIGTKEMEEKL
jgi:hypothetical protein